MKKLMILLALTVSLTASASHLLGGYMQAYQRGNTDTVDLYVTLFTDPQGISQSTIVVNEYKNVNGSYQSQANITVTNPQPGYFQGMNISQYHTVLVLTSGDYRFVYSNCCRGMMSNASSSMNSSFTIGMDFMKSSMPNSAPVLLNFLPSTWVTGTQQQSMMFSFDVDGDSISIEADDALNQYSTTGTFVPLAPFNQLNNYGTYNVNTNGVITWSPTTQGLFCTGYKISEYRNGSLIGVNRVQQVYTVVQGSTPNVSAPFNMTFNNDSTITINHDLNDGDSLQVGFTGSNYTNAQLFIYGIPTSNMSNTTWSLSSINQVGTFKGFLRIYNSTSNMDFPVTLVVNSTIGMQEYIKPGYHKIYDWNGNLIYDGERVPWRKLKGFYIHITNEGVEKIYVD